MESFALNSFIFIYFFLSDVCRYNARWQSIVSIYALSPSAKMEKSLLFSGSGEFLDTNCSSNNNVEPNISRGWWVKTWVFCFTRQTRRWRLFRFANSVRCCARMPAYVGLKQHRITCFCCYGCTTAGHGGVAYLQCHPFKNTHLCSGLFLGRCRTNALSYTVILRELKKRRAEGGGKRWNIDSLIQVA